MRHGLSRAIPWGRGVGIPLTVILCAVLSACLADVETPSPTRTPTARPAIPNVEPLLGHVGFYGVPSAQDIDEVAAFGGSLAVRSYEPGGVAAAALRRSGVGLVDTSIQRDLYSTFCPVGPGSCRALDQVAVDDLVRRSADRARAEGSSGVVRAWYLTDDYWTDMSSVLGPLRRALRAVAPEVPTVCAFNLRLEAPEPALAAFKVSLANYSPQWCDAVLVYAYRPKRAIELSLPVDWSMSATLEPALGLLRAAGWRPDLQPLIATPQAFGHSPRIVRGVGGIASEQFREPPDEGQLATQVAAFCRAGARSVIAYAWHDTSEGVVSDVSQSLSLRTGLIRGLRRCSWYRPS